MTNVEIYVEQIKRSLNWINGANVEEEHRTTIQRALNAQLNEWNKFREQEIMHKRQGKPWSKSDIEILEQTLKGKVADSDEAEKMNVHQLALRLTRQDSSVRNKAIELGFEKAVNYWLNRIPQNQS